MSRRRKSSSLRDARRAYRDAKRTARYIRKHPTRLLALSAGLAAMYVAHTWLHLGSHGQLWAGGIAAALVVLLWLVAGIGYSAVYVIYGLDPWDHYRSETVVYVGETSQAPWTDPRTGKVHYPRLEQHLEGGGKFRSVPKPWADTVTRWEFVYERRYGLKPIRMWKERRLTHRLLPLYPHEYNLRNDRRIDKYTAARQRAQRDAARSRARLG